MKIGILFMRPLRQKEQLFQKERRLQIAKSLLAPRFKGQSKARVLPYLNGKFRKYQKRKRLMLKWKFRRRSPRNSIQAFLFQKKLRHLKFSYRRFLYKVQGQLDSRLRFFFRLLEKDLKKFRFLFAKRKNSGFFLHVLSSFRIFMYFLVDANRFAKKKRTLKSIQFCSRREKKRKRLGLFARNLKKKDLRLIYFQSLSKFL